MAKRVNNISYKGIRHTPSLVSDADGYASECANLSPDGNDLKPMPMPVKVDGYTVTPNARVIFVHLGVGYKNYVELDADGIRIYLRDEEGNYLYYADPNSRWWLNESEVLAVEAIGDTLIVSTKGGTEYLVYRPDDELYKWLGQKPPMPVIEFRLKHEESDYYEEKTHDALKHNDESIPITNPNNDDIGVQVEYEETIRTEVNGLVSKIIKEAADDSKFIFPFYIRYAYRMRTGDYIMQSAPVLMLPSTDKCPIRCRLLYEHQSGQDYTLFGYEVQIHHSTLQYIVLNNALLEDWSDMISGVDIYISEPFYNYDTETKTKSIQQYMPGVYFIHHVPYTDIDFGKRFSNGEIEDISFDPTPYPATQTNCCYKIMGVKQINYHKRVQDNSLFHKVASIGLDALGQMSDYENLPLENLSNLTTMPTLPDDYNSHFAVSASLLQVYNSRLNMANIRQEVFKGFTNGFQPQSTYRRYPYETTTTYYRIDCAYYKVKKNGKTYIVQSDGGTSSEKLDYTAYLYYPDADCFEAVIRYRIGAAGSMVYTTKYLTIPMKRHEYLNGSYWYDDMKCLGQYIFEHDGTSEPSPQINNDLWYDIPNRFMMSSVGNPWHFPVGGQFDIGRREIRALSINAENMDAPQFGQNPIYVFSADGIWTIDINADGTFRKLNYVSGDVISEMDGIGGSPTASAQQATFFKTERGIMVIVRSQVKDISLAMKGRIFNPIMRLLPMHSVKDGIPLDGSLSRWRDLIDGVCDNIPFADFAASSSLLYDYRNDRLLLLPGNKAIRYMYVYDVQHDFWSKMMMLPHSSNEEEEESQGDRGADTQEEVSFTNSAMDGSMALLQDADGNLWQVGGQPDENDINTRQFGFYVSRPMRFGTDDMKTLSRIVHDQQLSIADEKIRMALYGSRDGRNFYQITTLRGTSYKFFVMVLYTHILPSSRYAYTAFEWEARMTDKIR